MENELPPVSFFTLDDFLVPAGLTVRQALIDQIRDNPALIEHIRSVPADDKAMMLSVQLAIPIALELVHEVVAKVESEAGQRETPDVS